MDELKKYQDNKGMIFVSYHKPFQIVDKEFIVPINAGRGCNESTKDGEKNGELKKWLLEHTIGDNTGDNISDRNSEFCECTALYWMWKNVDYSKLDYIGLFQYRRLLILNDYFEKAENDIEKKAYKCVHYSKKTKAIPKLIDLSETTIKDILQNYDCIVPYSTEFKYLDTSNAYDDWVKNIPGVHVGDLVELENVMKELHPEYADAFSKYLNSPQKRMYHLFIARPKVFSDYCEWLFELLFEVDKRIDSTLYTINGKRTMGYLAETLYGFYFTYFSKCNKFSMKETGVLFLD